MRHQIKHWFYYLTTMLLFKFDLIILKREVEIQITPTVQQKNQAYLKHVN